MITTAKITHRFLTEDGLYMQLYIPMVTEEYFKQKENDECEVIFIDDNTITAEQRKRIYATLKDIADFLGYKSDEIKDYLKFEFCKKYEIDDISFKDCSKYEASDFIDYLLDFCFCNNIPLAEEYGINRAYNITQYLKLCLKYKKCCVCGKKADLHHEDAIGMGNDRNKTDDSNKRKMALCRNHHVERHTIGEECFKDKYHVYGILWNSDDDWLDEINELEKENTNYESNEFC